VGYFKNPEHEPIRVQKLNTLASRVTTLETGGDKILYLSVTDGLPDADPDEPLLRVRVQRNWTIDSIQAEAGDGATSPTALRFRKDGVANGQILFTGTNGVASGIGDYPAGSLLEVYPPEIADPTLDDLSISIRVSLS
jgi:hypothetical protein